MEAEQFSDLIHLVDDSYFSALSSAGEELFPISDEKYAEQLQFQEVLISASQMARPPASTLIRIREKGESSSSSSSSSLASPSPATFFCKICMDAPPDADMFTNGSCSHSFCRDCLGRYVGEKIKENILTVKCPEVNCRSILEPQSFRGMIPREVLDRWEAAACEATILGMNRIYCPFKGCSAALVVDDEDGGVAALKEAECPHCRRLFCASCKVGWHAGLSCSEFQRLGTDERRREDLLLMEVAKEKGWRRCPKCKFFVEKTAGCLHITCRCGHEFCYGCGSKWATIHASCSTPN
ncbi:E3 ubiquitin-protein ligase RNF144A-like [Zingiber officinale]|uniref:RBR-type E3 ubiquitin transferase n=1 Tax=Zingiber officinale TaxID=94328 RepID=A0A8J5LKJ9_ZINOF|nr:E3 ubiquitin-protein ligase RNF144A-like [Zingiber officinale]KAG6516078.1 hypothetical protein ZIOFF_026526 [Zingiber officinale]